MLEWLIIIATAVMVLAVIALAATRSSTLSSRDSSASSSNGLFDVETDRLFDEELHEAIEAVQANDTLSNRQKLYAQLLKTTVCIPQSESSDNSEEMTIMATLNGSGEQMLVAFTDPPAMKRWTQDASSVLVMPTTQLCQMALDNNFPEISLNPAGPAGGVLTRHEIVPLAKGEIPA